MSACGLLYQYVQMVVQVGIRIMVEQVTNQGCRVVARHWIVF